MEIKYLNFDGDFFIKKKRFLTKINYYPQKLIIIIKKKLILTDFFFVTIYL